MALQVPSQILLSSYLALTPLEKVHISEYLYEILETRSSLPPTQGATARAQVRTRAQTQETNTRPQRSGCGRRLCPRRSHSKQRFGWWSISQWYEWATLVCSGLVEGNRSTGIPAVNIPTLKTDSKKISRTVSVRTEEETYPTNPKRPRISVQKIRTMNGWASRDQSRPNKRNATIKTSRETRRIRYFEREYRISITAPPA